jgi:ATP-binding cassette subfamily G (WHITE) protein 2 (SNQ2)
MCIGYLIPVPTMHPWFRWINYINPATYTFEALMANEMSGMILDCIEPQLVPYGPSYTDSQYRGCTIKGTMPGSTALVGSEFLHFQFLASASHIGRNAGIVIAFWIFFAVMAAVGFEVNLHSESGSKILFTRRNEPEDRGKVEDIEKFDGEVTTAGLGQLKLSKTLFTFKDISYFVHHDGKELQLLSKISGYVKPGQLVALMGSSGAGKTTLMDVLAQRKDSGKIEGSILVNGRPQNITFQRTTGYCEQNDIHEPTATVWESLMFAASLRQSYQIPTEEKREYVVAIMDLLELAPLRDAIVGCMYRTRSSFGRRANPHLSPRFRTIHRGAQASHPRYRTCRQTDLTLS